MSDLTVDGCVCTSCNCTVVYDEECTEEETCIRSKPFCTKPDDEHVDWRATCLHAQRCALSAEADLARTIADRDSYLVTVRMLRELLGAVISITRRRPLFDGEAEVIEQKAGLR